MIRLHYANRLENLIPPLAAAVAEQQTRRPLETVEIIVPSRVVEQFVKLRLAEAIGIASNLDFPFLRRYLARIVESADPKLKILDIEGIELALFESLRKSLASESAEMTPVRNYVAGGGAGSNERELRVFRLAREMARLFREYSITRRAMLRDWHKGALGKDARPAAAERWQRSLWLSVFDANGRMRSVWTSDRERNLMLLPDAFESAALDLSKAAIPARLHVFGLAYAGPAYARIFARIGELSELNIYALNPCLEFWEDVESAGSIARGSWVRRHQRFAGGFEESTDPFQLDVAGDTPALRLWARPGREFIRLLNELTDCDFEPHFTHPGNARAATMLGRLQESILIREPERPQRADGDTCADDGSIRFLACPGIRREAEIVANEIWSLVLGDDARSDRTRFHQIGVMVPDRRYDAYVAHLETVFSELHRIPIEVVNRGFASESRVFEAVALLLRLPLGRFSREEMLHLLTHPSVSGGDPENDPARWREWCGELGVFFGADADDLAGTYIPRDLFHWDQALKRLALGVFMDSGQKEDSRFFAAPDGFEYLPHPVAQDEAAGVAAFARTARAMLSDALEIRSRRMPLGEWARLLGDLVLTYIRTPDALDERVRDYCVGAIESIAAPEISIEPVPFQVAYELAAARISELEAEHGQFGERGVAVGPLSALRAIPFRTIFLLGLNEAEFPQRSPHDPIDLRLSRRKAGDVTPTERDRYLFLETLTAARERIYFSYVARDAQTGDRLEPSSVVRELQLILRGYMDRETLESLTVEHPVSRYDPEYFRAGSPALSERGLAKLRPRSAAWCADGRAQERLDRASWRGGNSGPRRSADRHALRRNAGKTAPRVACD